MTDLREKFAILDHIIGEADTFLVVAHSRPDPDTVGATIAMTRLLTTAGKRVTLTCTETFPVAFDAFLPSYTLVPTRDIDLHDYRVIVGCDNIDRGFASLLSRATADQITVGIDHHPHTALAPDLLITDSAASSTCEILYEFCTERGYALDTAIATALLIGILGDTRIFRNPNTSARTVEVAAGCAAAGASVGDIIRGAFLRKDAHILRLWGQALQNARFDTANRAIVTAITGSDLFNGGHHANDLKEEIKEIASLLATVPEAAFAMVLMQITPHSVKVSLRAESDRGTDTSAIARSFGGDGHRLASGFEVPGMLVPRGDTWMIV